MKSIFSKALALCTLFGCAASAYAIPTLQVGVPQAVPMAGNKYVDYTTVGSNPDQQTAFTTSTSIVVGGAYKNSELLIGGQYRGSKGTGLTWAAVLGDTNKYAAFNALNGGKGARAILVASVRNGSLSDPANFLKISTDGGASYLNPFFTSQASLFPNNHYPAQDGVSDFLYFDIGNFVKNAAAVPNFDESIKSDKGKTTIGEIKNLLISTSGFQWIHFDVMALKTQNKIDTKTGLLTTTLVGNPGSHDVSWRPGISPFGVPEPATPLLLGLGLIGMLMMARRARSK